MKQSSSFCKQSCFKGWTLAAQSCIDPSTSGLCTAGYYWNGGSTIPTQNVAQPGYYAPAGSANQIAWAIGYYNPYMAQAACIQCKQGYDCPSTGMSIMTDCPVGKFWIAGSSTVVHENIVTSPQKNCHSSTKKLSQVHKKIVTRPQKNCHKSTKKLSLVVLILYFKISKEIIKWMNN